MEVQQPNQAKTIEKETQSLDWLVIKKVFAL